MEMNRKYWEVFSSEYLVEMCKEQIYDVIKRYAEIREKEEFVHMLQDILDKRKRPEPVNEPLPEKPSMLWKNTKRNRY